ncbi:MAG: hypothetical protein ACHREM_24995 [Polyangiales bacterium]
MKSSTVLAAATLSALVFSESPANANQETEPAASSVFRVHGSVLVSSTGGGSIASSIAGGALPWVAATPFVSIAHDSNDGTGATATSSTAIIVNPALDYFVVTGLSIGGEIAFSKEISDVSDNEFTVVAFAPRVGWDFVLGSDFSVWVRGGASFAYETLPNSTRTIVSGSLDAQLLWHPSLKFFVGVGPGVTRDFFAPGSSTDASTGQSISGEGEHHTRIRILAFTIGGVL